MDIVILRPEPGLGEHFNSGKFRDIPVSVSSVFCDNLPDKDRERTVIKPETTRVPDDVTDIAGIMVNGGISMNFLTIMIVIGAFLVSTLYVFPGTYFSVFAAAVGFSTMITAGLVILIVRCNEGSNGKDQD